MTSHDLRERLIEMVESLCSEAYQMGQGHRSWPGPFTDLEEKVDAVLSALPQPEPGLREAARRVLEAWPNRYLRGERVVFDEALAALRDALDASPPEPGNLAAFTGDAQHPDQADYMATNLLDALEQVPATGDWWFEAKAWCERTKTGRLRPNREPTPPPEPVVTDETVKLRAKCERQARELAKLNKVIHRKNLELDALHMVWCDGGCLNGVHRWEEGPVTEEIVATAERNTARLRKWFNSTQYRIRQAPASGYLRERADELIKKTGLE